MTLENFNYRTDPMFLRNQFVSNNRFGIPTIPKPDFEEDELLDLRLFPFNRISSDDGKHSSRIVHFFLYDYNFEKIWSDPEKSLTKLLKYKGLLSPDFSMYLEMPYALQIYNTFRNRWCGAYFASKGLKVIPTINWGDEKSFDFCFSGVEKGSIVAVSTYMFHEHNNHADQKDIFMKGYNKMLEVIEPSKIICYSEPFDEMQGNIIHIDYDLSSWTHFEDDAEKSFIKKYTSSLYSSTTRNTAVFKMGYVFKGGGSAYGGDWIPKKESDERFLGDPNTISNGHKDTTQGGYDVQDKYDDTGRAIMERHLTDHGRSDLHSNPHDHEISWENGSPKPGPPINYFDGNVPEFKKYNNKGEMKMSKPYNPDDDKFESVEEFRFVLDCGANVGFEYNGVEYGIEGHNDSFDIWIYNKGDIANGLTLEEALDYELDGKKIKDIILDATIIERML